MRIIRLDRRITGAAIVAAFFLILPMQIKRLPALAHYAKLLLGANPFSAPTADVESAQGDAVNIKSAGAAPTTRTHRPAASAFAFAWLPVIFGEAEKRALHFYGLNGPVALGGDRASQRDAILSRYDLSGVTDALIYYHVGKTAEGDAALTTKDPTVRAAVEWMFLLTHPAQAGMSRIVAFMRAHKGWPDADLRRNAETLAADDAAKPESVAAYFAEFPPTTTLGRIVYAALIAKEPGRKAEADKMAREMWRDSNLTAELEKRLRKSFGSVLTRADQIHRLDRMMEREDGAAARRAAVLAGKEGDKLYRAEASLAKGVKWEKVSRRVPAALRHDPGIIFERIHNLRHADHIDEAAKLMLSAPRDPTVLGSPDDWWVERRLLARKLLDSGKYEQAYKICAENRGGSDKTRLQAEFHAGWIALRFLKDPKRAEPHFEKLAAIAQRPHSVARANYWLGRVAEAEGKDGKTFYARAAAFPETYYGQLARAKLGDEPVILRAPAVAAQGSKRAEPVRAAELLYALGEIEPARKLALDSARTLTNPAQMAALSRVIKQNSDAHTDVIAGKAAMHRGIAVDSLAYPLDGVPDYVALANSASRPLVLAIARQESAFRSDVRSGAGAVGLMQMAPATARSTARQAGVDFDETKLLKDAAFNAQLGAYHLGQLLRDYDGSYILAFAAYNAGGGNVRDWIKAYGDPRDPKVNPVDWIERIPFTETRNYVQHIMENLQVYRARLGDDGAPNLYDVELRQQVAEGG